MDFKFNLHLGTDEKLRLMGDGAPPKILASLGSYQIREEMRGEGGDQFTLLVVFDFGDVAVPLWERNYGRVSTKERARGLGQKSRMNEALKIITGFLYIEEGSPEVMNAVLGEIKERLLEEFQDEQSNGNVDA